MLQAVALAARAIVFLVGNVILVLGEIDIAFLTPGLGAVAGSLLLLNSLSCLSSGLGYSHCSSLVLTLQYLKMLDFQKVELGFHLSLLLNDHLFFGVLCGVCQARGRGRGL